MGPVGVTGRIIVLLTCSYEGYDGKECRSTMRHQLYFDGMGRSIVLKAAFLYHAIYLLITSISILE